MSLIVDNKLIETPVKDIIELLRQQLFLNKIDKLDRIEIKQNNIRVTCPIHAGGHERTPSCDILMEDKGDTSAGTVHCFSADTEIITSLGVRKIGACCNNFVDILNGAGNWETVYVANCGKQRLYKVTLSNGGNQYKKRTLSIFCTAKHRWFYKKAYKNNYKMHEVTTDMLPTGIYLPSVLTKCSLQSFDIEGLRHGFIYGDGFKNHNNKYCKQGTAVFYTKHKEKLLKYFNNAVYKQHPSGNYYMASYKSRFDLTIPPDDSVSNEYKLGFLIGYFAADGSFGANTYSVSNANYEHLIKIRDMCVSLGIVCKPIYSRYRLGINNKYSYIYSFKIFANSVPPFFDITDRALTRKSSMTYSRWCVDTIEETDRFEDVYCCETSTGSFVLANNILTGNCFGCGYRAGLVKFIADCLNISYRRAAEWVLSVSSYSFIETDRTRELGDIDFNNANKIKWPTVSLDELKKYDNMHPYMRQRKLTDEIINKFDVGYDIDLDAITFPLYVNGQCVLVAKRRVKFKRFDMPKIDPKPIYGLDYLTENEVIVCESIINALTCWSYGKQAIALCGTGSTWQIEQLNNIPQRKIVLALDGDEAGKAGTKRIMKGLTNKIVTVLKLPDGKDINDLSKEEFENLEEEI